MKPTSPTPHDPLDELLAAAVHGELTAAQRVELDALLQHDPAARAAHQEIQTMHDLLEKNHREVKPDPNFEDRMISGVRRKVREKSQRETAWGSALFLWRGLVAMARRPSWTAYVTAAAVILIFAGIGFVPLTKEINSARSQVPAQDQLQIANGGLITKADLYYRTGQYDQAIAAAKKVLTDDPYNASAAKVFEKSEAAKLQFASTAGTNANADGLRRIEQTWSQPTPTENDTRLVTKSGEQSVVMDLKVPPVSVTAPPTSDLAINAIKPCPAFITQTQSEVSSYAMPAPVSAPPLMPVAAPVTADDAVDKNELAVAAAPAATREAPATTAPINALSGATKLKSGNDLKRVIQQPDMAYQDQEKKGVTLSGYVDASRTYQFAGVSENAPAAPRGTAVQSANAASALAAAPQLTRKLIRDATLDLEVKAYQPTVDTITDLAKADGGYLDSSNSQRGGNGKLQGAVIAKVAPDKLDAFLLKLRELGTLKNQSVSTEDVTKDYYDTEARLDNSRRMETQLQELLKRDNGKVSELLQVERELGRVRGDIEQMQGQLKLYDFQVQYATVTISVAEKDLNKAAAYLLQEHDQFALFVHDVEAAFSQAKAAADTYKAQILNADLEHESDSTMNATLAFSVPPEQVDAFLAKVKGLGRVDNFTRTTNRVANDGGDSDEPADETRTDKDRAQVQLTIHADDESPRQQTQLAIASTADIDTQAQQLKDGAAASGAAVTASSFERETDGTETATLTFRLPLAKVGDFMPVLEKLGRVESLAVHRDDQPGQAAADANAPAEIDLRLHNVAAASFENEPPRQATQLAVISTGNVDVQAQQVKGDALKAGVTVTSSTFNRSPDGVEQAALTFRLPLAQAAGFTADLEKLGKIESLAIQRNDVPGPNSTDPNAPAEISLTLHDEPAIVAENRGFWPTMRHLFGGGVTAFLHSVETIGVLAAFLAPWLAAGFGVAFLTRRAYVAYRLRKTAA